MFISKSAAPAVLALLALAGACALAQDESKQRAKAVREMGKGGSEAIPRIEPYLSDPVLDVRLEVVDETFDHSLPRRRHVWGRKKSSAVVRAIVNSSPARCLADSPPGRHGC